MKKILTSVYTGNGDRRRQNQDSVFCKTEKVRGKTVGLFIVADGCGGMANGKLISDLVTSSFARLWDEKLLPMFAEKKVRAADIHNTLDKEMENINSNTLEFCRRIGERGGSTVSLLLIINTRYFIKNVGDSRVYRVRRGIKQLTQDQTLTADMVKSGELSAKEAANHKKRNVLSMCIGYPGKLKIYSVSGRIFRGDNFVVCCDGFYNCLNNKTIKRYIKRCRGKYFENAAAEMRNMIEPGSASDNVSVILARCKGWYL